MPMKIRLDQCGQRVCLESHVSMYATMHDPKWPIVTETVRFRTSSKEASPQAGSTVTYMDKDWTVQETKYFPSACRWIIDCRRMDLDACSSTLVDIYQYQQDSNCDGLDGLKLIAQDVPVGISQIGTSSELVNGGRMELRQYRVYSTQAASWTHLTRISGSMDLKVKEVVTEADSMPYAVAVESPFPLSEV